VTPSNQLQITPKHVARNIYLHFINSNLCKQIASTYFLFCLNPSFPTFKKNASIKKEILGTYDFQGLCKQRLMGQI
jgi:hypothetical protein